MFNSPAGSWIKCAQVGDKISVEIQTVIGDGLVVSFTDSDGAEYRGALLKTECGNCRYYSTQLCNGQTVRVIVNFIPCTCRQLQQSATACVSTPHNQLANPLSFLHDHPYSQMKNYGMFGSISSLLV